jgi:hypothetical protein
VEFGPRFLHSTGQLSRGARLSAASFNSLMTRATGGGVRAAPRNSGSQ